jgi:hypothetical protein
MMSQAASSTALVNYSIIFPLKFTTINVFYKYINLLAPELFFNFSTLCIQNVNNTGTKYIRIMKQTAF